MNEGVGRMLGIRKGTSLIYESWYWLRKAVSLRMIVVTILLSLFTTGVILFAHYEFLARPEVSDQLAIKGISPYFQSVYWLVTTITTVGYGDVVPETIPGKVVALAIMVLGMITMSLIISQVTSRIVSMNLGSMFGVTKTRKKIDCIICGWNPISESAFQEIKKPGMEIVVIDKENRPELAKAKDLHFMTGDPTNPDILRRANVMNAKNVVLAMEKDADVLLAIHVIRDLNPWINIVAKINNHEHVHIAESAGADQVVSPPSIGGRLLSLVADSPSVVDWVTRATSREKGSQLIEYHVTKESPFAGKTISDARKQLGDSAKIIGVDTAEGLEKIPGDDLRIESGNKLIMIIDTTKFKMTL
ncbi:MAG: potassium channel protein [Candidatus Woesearchaeota archaeon]